ncbi:TIGR04063 family PEP-CTERM/XrtA system glycosyltransferase [Oxalobacteraceae bacterium A2-2]
MRILHILDHSAPLHSGYAFRTLEILRHQRKLGWHTLHLTGNRQGQQHGAGLEQQVEGWHFYRTAPPQRRWARLPLLRQWAAIDSLAARLRDVAQLGRVQILHAHSPALNALAALRVGTELGLPVAYEVRAFWEDAAASHGTSPAGGARYRLTRALETYAVRRAGAVITICDGLRADLLRRGVPPDKVTVVPNAVDPARFSPARAPSVAATFAGSGNGMLAQRLGLGGSLVLGFIGSFYAYEGLALLLRALPAMLSAVPSLQLLLVGGGPQEAELRALAAELGLAHKVKFAGRIGQDETADYYRLMDVLVYPRLPMRLTELVTPLKPLEAMVQGRLVVASDVGGHRELVRDGHTGILFQAGSADALAGAVLGLLRDPGRWEALRQAAQSYAETERSWSASVSCYAGVYRRLLEGRP